MNPSDSSPIIAEQAPDSPTPSSSSVVSLSRSNLTELIAEVSIPDQAYRAWLLREEVGIKADLLAHFRLGILRRSPLFSNALASRGEAFAQELADNAFRSLLDGVSLQYLA